MGKIVILDENTANKIAAGEVIERPASVIKELVENSIDAGAGSIGIEVKNGGISYIKITDNGSGIREDDAVIAFERHATSKIRSADDLEQVLTMGFRGEALASIAAVADVQVTTRVRESEHGTFVEVRGGHVLDVRQTGCPAGTTITVKDLFFNTPARYKFLKKDTTEAGYISETVSRIALGNPGISFKLLVGGSQALYTPGNNDQLSTIFSIYGKETAKNVYEVNYSNEKIKISGYVGKPEIARSNRSHQYVYINRRFIKSKIITSAVDEAYNTFLMKNKFPFILLNIEINPMMVDVNVHPNKMEVKFSNEQDIFKAVYHAVNNALLGNTGFRQAAVSEKPYRNPFKMDNTDDELNDFSQQSIRFTGIAGDDSSMGNAARQSYMESGAAIEKQSGSYGVKKLQDRAERISDDSEANFSVKTTFSPITRNAEAVLKERAESAVRVMSTAAAGCPTAAEAMVSSEVKETSEVKERIEVKESIEVKETAEHKVLEASESYKTAVQYTGSSFDVSTEASSKAPAELSSEVPAELYSKVSAAKKEEVNVVYSTGRTTVRYDEASAFQYADATVEPTVKPNDKPTGKPTTKSTVESAAKESHETDEKTAEMADEFPQRRNLFEGARIVGQLFSTYIILQQGEQMILIDQHAAHERIMYEELKQRFDNMEPMAQMLLESIVIELTHQELKLLDEERELFDRLGFEFEAFGSNSIILRAVPFSSLGHGAKEIFIETLDKMLGKAKSERISGTEHALYTIACKAAVKANKKLDDMEMEKLLKQLEQLENPFTCPHGRPSAVRITKYELEKMFKRIV